MRIALLDTFFSVMFGATLSSHDKYLEQAHLFFSSDGKQINQANLVDYVYNSPIEDLYMSSTAFDEGTKENSMYFDSSETPPLLLEVKQFRNLSKPYQRISKTDTSEKSKVGDSGIKRDHTFSLIAHDGVRFIKLVLLMKNQASIVKDLHEKNKFLLKSGYVDSTTEKGNTIILVDGMDQLAMVHNDKGAPKLTEQ